MYIYRVLSPGVRLFHWLMVGCMVVLFTTGLYIGSPGYIGTQGTEPTVAVASLFSMETIRFIHFTAAFVFAGGLLLRIYLLFTYPGNRQFPNFRSGDYWRGLGEMIAYYTFLRPQHRDYLRNPLAATAYLIAYALMLVELVTGLAMYAMVAPNSFVARLVAPVNGWLGNEYMTHVVHHIVAWFFLIFAFGHVYMVVYNDIVEKRGELSSIVSGRKLYKKRPVDAKDSLIVK